MDSVLVDHDLDVCVEGVRFIEFKDLDDCIKDGKLIAMCECGQLFALDDFDCLSPFRDYLAILDKVASVVKPAELSVKQIVPEKDPLIMKEFRIGDYYVREFDVEHPFNVICTCPDFQHRCIFRSNRVCKHIKQLQEQGQL